jgi:hypothetical protein
MTFRLNIECPLYSIRGSQVNLKHVRGMKLNLAKGG